MLLANLATFQTKEHRNVNISLHILFSYYIELMQKHWFYFVFKKLNKLYMLNLMVFEHVSK